MKKHNFFAGPSILPQYTIDKSIEGIRDFAGSGLSVLEISHRSKEFIACMNEAISLVKELLDVPQGYQVIFLGGGASLQFAMVPMNLLSTKAAYLNTGEWANKALKEIEGKYVCVIDVPQQPTKKQPESKYTTCKFVKVYVSREEAFADVGGAQPVQEVEYKYSEDIVNSVKMLSKNMMGLH